MENKFLEDLESGGLKEALIYMMVHGDSYFDVYYSDIEEVNETYNTKFKDLDEAWKFISKEGFGDIKQVFHNWNDIYSAWIVWECEKYGEFYGAHVGYSSYEGYDYEYVTLKRVFPKEKTVIVYE